MRGKNLKNGKAASKDEVTGEMIKVGDMLCLEGKLPVRSSCL